VTNFEHNILALKIRKVFPTIFSEEKQSEFILIIVSCTDLMAIHYVIISQVTHIRFFFLQKSQENFSESAATMFYDAKDL